MKTDDLLRAVVADHATRPEPVARRFAVLSALGLIGAGCLFAFLLKPRADLALELASPRVAFKLLFSVALAVVAGAHALRQTRPEAPPGWRSALALPLALLAAAIVAELLVSPPSTWGPRLVGSNALACLGLIPLMSSPLLVAALAGLRHGAPARPARAGAIAGLFAGALGAGLYAMHCVDDSPLFVAAWYGLALVGMAAAGAALGARLLRW